MSRGGGKNRKFYVNIIFEWPHDLNILCTNTVTTALLYFNGASVWKFMTNPVSVGLVYHFEANLQSFRMIFMSKKGNALSCSTSMVNFKDGIDLLQFSFDL